MNRFTKVKRAKKRKKIKNGGTCFGLRFLQFVTNLNLAAAGGCRVVFVVVVVVVPLLVIVVITFVVVGSHENVVKRQLIKLMHPKEKGLISCISNLPDLPSTRLRNKVFPLLVNFLRIFLSVLFPLFFWLY